MTFLYEAHTHTKPVSICSRLTPDELVHLHVNAGFSGIAITNHFCDDTFSKAGLWDASSDLWADYYLKDYYLAKAAAEKEKDFAVFLGMEIRFIGSMNEYLVYGLDEGFFYKYSCKEIIGLGIDKFREIADSNHLLVIQAHPYRPENVPVDARLLDGVEIFNSNVRADSKNDLAYQYAMNSNLAGIAGSDVHRPVDVGVSGMISPKRINNKEEFKSFIKSNPHFYLNNMILGAKIST